MTKIKIDSPIEDWYGEMWIDQIKAIPDNDECEITINSFGGGVVDAFSIVREIADAKNRGVKFTTKAINNCASSAILVFLAGDTRIVSEGVFMYVHQAYILEEVNATVLEKELKNLKLYDLRIAQYYSARTKLTEDEALELLKEDRALEVSEIKRLGFANKIYQLNSDNEGNILNKKEKNKNSLNIKKMNQKIKAKKVNKKENLLKRIFNEITKITAGDEEIVFTNVEEGEMPIVGESMATIGGSPANGEYTMLDGSIYLFVEGLLTEITDAEEVPETEEETEAPVEEKPNATASINDRISALEKKISNFSKENSDLKKELEKSNAKVSNLSKIVSSSDKDVAGRKKEVANYSLGKFKINID